jgi:hypothetical protein
MRFQACALPVQQELGKPNPVDVARQLPPDLLEGGRGAADELFRPFQITAFVVSDFQRAKQCVVVQPMGVIVAKLLELLAQILSGAGSKVLPGRLEHGELEGLDGVEVDGRGRKRAAGTVCRSHQPVLDQPVGADQQWVAGERRQGLIG